MRLLFDKGALFYAEYNWRLFLLLLFRKKDCLLSNDLDTLLANFMAQKLSSKTDLVYDSHEYYTEVPELVARPKVKKIWESIEKKLFPKLKHVYTVNDSIASFYHEKYKIHIDVIRNISLKFTTTQAILSKEELGLPLDKNIIILQGAGINVDRGAEEMIQAMQYIEGAIFLIVGDGDVVPELKIYVAEHDLSDKVIFKGRQPYLTMMNYTIHSDLGLSLDKTNNLNYKYALPNKLFDYIHTTTPIACSNTVEVSKIVRDENIGIVIPNHDPKTIAKEIQELLDNKELLAQMKLNCEKAAQYLNWENESKKLQLIYAFLND
jgi:glycosyltransferase involved in cell wall biosynthesis